MLQCNTTPQSHTKGSLGRDDAGPGLGDAGAEPRDERRADAALALELVGRGAELRAAVARARVVAAVLALEDGERALEVRRLGLALLRRGLGRGERDAGVRDLDVARAELLLA